MMFASAASSMDGAATMSVAGATRGAMRSAGGMSKSAFRPEAMSMSFGTSGGAMGFGPDFLDEPAAGFDLSAVEAIARIPAVTEARHLKGAREVVAAFDWNSYVPTLTSVPLGALPLAFGALLSMVAAIESFQKVAKASKVDGRILAVGVIALLLAENDRTAQRVARKVLAGVPEIVVDALRAELATMI